MDFNQIRYFLVLADTLNFSRAAEQCAVSQPALTQSIKRLEEELGGKLIDRDGAKSSLTNLGASLRDQFRQIDHTRKLVKATAQSIVAGVQAELNVGVMCTIGAQQIANMLGEFRAVQPKVSVVLHDVVPDSIPELLLSGALDGAFCSREGPAQDHLRYVPLFPERMMVACAENHKFSQRDAVSLEEIAGQPYVDRLHCEFRSKFLDYINEHDLALDVAASSQREDWIQSLVSRGVGVTILPEYSVVDADIVTKPITDNGLARTVEFAIRSSASLSVGLSTFLGAAESYEWS